MNKLAYSSIGRAPDFDSFSLIQNQLYTILLVTLEVTMKTKVCNKCNTEKSIDDFNDRKLKTKTVKQSICKKCQSDYSKNHFQKNKEYYYLKKKKYSEEYKKWFEELKSNLSCECCGYNKCIGALDFHHVDINTKEKNIAEMIASQTSKLVVLEEIKKCTVLCANCHRELHYNE